jgi:REP element-mobilizing transposase RayT
MARMARVFVPDHPHHVTRRSNGRARTFFGDLNYALYRDLRRYSGRLICPTGKSLNFLSSPF